MFLADTDTEENMLQKLRLMTESGLEWEAISGTGPNGGDANTTILRQAQAKVEYLDVLHGIRKKVRVFIYDIKWLDAAANIIRRNYEIDYKHRQFKVDWHNPLAEFLDAALKYAPEKSSQTGSKGNAAPAKTHS